MNRFYIFTRSTNRRSVVSCCENTFFYFFLNWSECVGIRNVCWRNGIRCEIQLNFSLMYTSHQLRRQLSRKMQYYHFVREEHIDINFSSYFFLSSAIWHSSHRIMSLGGFAYTIFAFCINKNFNLSIFPGMVFPFFFVPSFLCHYHWDSLQATDVNGFFFTFFLHFWSKSSQGKV